MCFVANPSKVLETRKIYVQLIPLLAHSICIHKYAAGYNNVVLLSEIHSGMCAKLRIVAASNNIDHAHNLSYYCLLALHI